MKDRLYLFDIDGTLISTGGAGGAAMRAAFMALFRLGDGFNAIEFSGRSDRAILRSAVAQARLDDHDFGDVLRRFKRAYFRRLPATLAANRGRVLPGVVALLDRLGRDSGATLSLGTGNFRNSARMKLRYYGLDQHFRFHGGFGDLIEDRAELIEQGIRSAQRAAGKHSTVLVIGDTIHDISAAKANNTVAIGVATGTSTRDELARAGADFVLDTLEQARDVLSTSKA